MASERFDPVNRTDEILVGNRLLLSAGEPLKLKIPNVGAYTKEDCKVMTEASTEGS